MLSVFIMKIQCELKAVLRASVKCRWEVPRGGNLILTTRAAKVNNMNYTTCDENHMHVIMIIPALGKNRSGELFKLILPPARHESPLANPIVATMQTTNSLNLSHCHANFAYRHSKDANFAYMVPSPIL